MMTQSSARKPLGARTWLAVAVTFSLFAGACSASPTPGPSASPSPTAAQSASATASAIASGPISSLPAGCPADATGTATTPRVSIADIETQGYPDYDALVFDFDRGLPSYAITSAVPPFTRDPSDLPLTVEGTAFFSVVFQGASIVDEEFQKVYEGPTDFKPNLTRITHVVMAGDFEAVSTWIVGLAAPACLAIQSSPPDRLVIAFFDAP
jgi:hypothetical protein